MIRLEPDFLPSTLITAALTFAAIAAVIYVGERPARVLARSVERAAPGSDNVVCRTDRRSRLVLKLIAAQIGGPFRRPGLYFSVGFSPKGFTVWTRPGSSFTIPSSAVRDVRLLDYRASSESVQAVLLEFDLGGKTYQLPLVPTSWWYYYHRPWRPTQVGGMLRDLNDRWELDGREASK